MRPFSGGMTFHYDSDAGLLKTACAISQTVVPMVLLSFEFWFFFAIHLAVFFSFRAGLFGSHQVDKAANLGLDWDFVQVASAITTFFEVFYASQCFARYMELYKATTGMFEDAYAFAYLLRAHIGEEGQAAVRLSTRFMIAAMVLQVFEMKKIETESTGSGSGDLDVMVKFGLLKRREAESMRSQKQRHRAMTALGWSAGFALKGLNEAEAHHNLHSVMTIKLFKIKSGQQDIISTLALPVPYQYVHLLSIMVCINLTLWAYSIGLSNSIFAPVVFFFASLIFLGMLELSHALSDPFGEDEVDFNVDAWMAKCVEQLIDIIEDFYPGHADGMRNACGAEGLLSQWADTAKTIFEEVAVNIEESHRHPQGTSRYLRVPEQLRDEDTSGPRTPPGTPASGHSRYALLGE